MAVRVGAPASAGDRQRPAARSEAMDEIAALQQAFLRRRLKPLFPGRP